MTHWARTKERCPDAALRLQRPNQPSSRHPVERFLLVSFVAILVAMNMAACSFLVQQRYSCSESALARLPELEATMAESMKWQHPPHAVSDCESSGGAGVQGYSPLSARRLTDEAARAFTCSDRSTPHGGAMLLCKNAGLTFQMRVESFAPEVWRREGIRTDVWIELIATRSG